MASGQAGLNFQALSGQPYGFRSAVAAGSSQTDALALATYSGMFYNVTSANGTKGVKLPTAPTGGKYIYVKNDETGSGLLKVYGSTGVKINSGSANAAYTIAVGATVLFVATSPTNWVSLASIGGGTGSGASSLTLADAHIFVGNSSSVATDVAVSGDLSLADTGAFTVTGLAQATGLSVTGATTPQLTTAAGSTNTGYFLVNGKTSGSTKYTTADATGQAITISPAAQTVGAVTLTTPDFAGVNDTFAFITKQQTFANKTFSSGLTTGSPAENVAAGGAQSIVTVYKSATNLANNSATDFDVACVVTVPNANHSGSVFVEVHGALGDQDSTNAAGFNIAISRISGAAAKATVSSAAGSATTTGATANATTTITAVVAGGAGSSNTINIKVTVARSAGASTNHDALARITLFNTKSTGMTIA